MTLRIPEVVLALGSRDAVRGDLAGSGDGRTRGFLAAEGDAFAFFF